MPQATDRYAILFEPVRIGPKVTRNRFYQVPHCNGMGHLRPRAHAAMRAVKAEGGWGVISTEETEIHPTSDISPAVEQRLWDDRDIPPLQLMTEAVHVHGSLAAVELVHNGFHSPNLTSRVPPLSPGHRVTDGLDPVQARAMSLSDIRDLRRWHRDAALRARRADFDIVYVYAGHCMALPQHFLLKRFNERTDDYGGSLENRLRLTRELLEDTLDAVGSDCAVAFRFAVDELLGADGFSSAEAEDVVGLLAELPDLWDVNVSGWSNDSVTARFEPIEGYQERSTAFVKRLTTKPVVGVGRFTSPDVMVAQVKKGLLDLIGAARPSIADPFLPEKIRSGRIDEIRECIGCNICVAGDNRCVPMRCTQNPTVGEEWRRGWHPEQAAVARSKEPVLVVGAGPAGLECALHLAQRGYPVTLAEATRRLGGRSVREATLPGLASYARVAAYREGLLAALPHVEIYRESALSAEDILGMGFAHVFLATGSRWRADGVGRATRVPIPGLELWRSEGRCLTPDDVMDGKKPVGTVLVFDDDHSYPGGVLAEAVCAAGNPTILVTPASLVSAWTVNTLEQERIQRRLIEMNVEILTNRALAAAHERELELACSYTGRRSRVACDAVIVVTERQPNESLATALRADPGRLKSAGIHTLQVIGDAFAPGLIAAAVYSGHAAARGFEEDAAVLEAQQFRREMPELGGVG